MNAMPRAPKPLGKADRQALAALLDGADGALSFVATSGLFAALTVIPRLVSPREWIPMIVGERPFADEDEFNRILGWLMGHYNDTVTLMSKDPRRAPPSASSGDLEDWCEGFLLGMELDTDEVDDDDEIATLLGTLAIVAGRIPLDEAELVKSVTPGEARREIGEVVPDMVASLYYQLAEARSEGALASGNAATPVTAAKGPKVGRNAPCPCGSGKKYKRCCGAN